MKQAYPTPPKRRFFRYLSDLLFPPTCVGCEELLPPFDPQMPIFCPACAVKSEAGLCEDSVTFATDGSYLVHFNLYHYRPGMTHGVPEKLIYHIKCRGEARVFAYVARMMSGGIRTVWQVVQPTINAGDVVWVYPPRRPSAIRKHGFDQAERLARVLAAACGGRCLPVLRHTRKRAKEQKRLSAADRRENTARAFTLSRRLAPRINGRPVMLVDDVCTTGATLTACTELLRDAGASCVMWITVARTKGNRGDEGN